MKSEFEEIISELDISEPSQELLDWAKENIREDPETKCLLLEEFRDMIYARGECVPHRTDDAFLLRFLRARNFSLEAAYQLFVNYYDFKEKNPHLFENVSLKNLEKIGPHYIITVPPYRDQNGRRTLLYRIGNWNLDEFSVDEVFRSTMIVLELAILEQRAQILGGVCIIDLGNMSMQQAWHMTPNIAQRVLQIMVTSFPMKVHALHIVNNSWIFDTVYNLFKPFLNDRMRERIFVHGDNMESLHKHINPKCLPKIYGGVHPDYDSYDWIIGFRKNKTIMKELDSLGYGENDEQKDIEVPEIEN